MITAGPSALVGRCTPPRRSCTAPGAWLMPPALLHSAGRRYQLTSALAPPSALVAMGAPVYGRRDDDNAPRRRSERSICHSGAQIPESKNGRSSAPYHRTGRAELHRAPASARSALNPRRLGTALQRFCSSQQRSDLTATHVVSPCMAIKADSLRVAVNRVGGMVDHRCSPSCIAL
jgi:hypothetical protein